MEQTLTRGMFISSNMASNNMGESSLGTSTCKLYSTSTKTLDISMLTVIDFLKGADIMASAKKEGTLSAFRKFYCMCAVFIFQIHNCYCLLISAVREQARISVIN